ncbi:BnaC07g03740D [Brassica napus]|uniref:BnaC07g03740D protein n=1 Tax=Brassica napus TaxID=3708 RepID=A0A078GKM4_BRANA|nr:BnaC07g03740D [Brassica napus]
MGIPWICSWHFTLAIALQDMPYSLLREFRVKWWEKYNIDRCSLANIQKYFQIVNQTKTAIQTISKSTPLLNLRQISQTNQNPQTHKRPTSSPTSLTTSSSSQKSLRKEKMKTFLAEMLAQFEAENSDIEESNQQVNDTQAEDPYGGPLGQDPFE